MSYGNRKQPTSANDGFDTGASRCRARRELVQERRKPRLNRTRKRKHRGLRRSYRQSALAARR